MLLPPDKQPGMLRKIRSYLLENAREDIGRSYWSNQLVATGIFSQEGSSVDQQNPGVNCCNITVMVHWRRFAPVVPTLVTHNWPLLCHLTVSMQISYACMTHLFHLISQSTSMQLEVLNYHADRHHLKASKSIYAYISPKSKVNEMPFL